MKRTEKSELKVLEIDKVEQLAGRVGRRDDWGEVFSGGAVEEGLAVIGCPLGAVVAGTGSLSSRRPINMTWE